jgi:hypothetical protein
MILLFNVCHRLSCWVLLLTLISNGTLMLNRYAQKRTVAYIFLKHLKRSGVELEDLLLFYYTAIRSILEYACPAWHTSITSEQSDRIETIQKRALSIIFNFSVFENYGNFCAHNGIGSLAKRRDDLCRKFFDRNVLNDCSCLQYLLPIVKMSILRTNLETNRNITN